MKILVVEDDFASRLLLQHILEPHAEVHIAVDGEEALTAFEKALKAGEPYNLICLDIMMPKMDGLSVLREIRKKEEAENIHGLDGVKIIMTTALDDKKTIMSAFKSQCEAYLTKPIDKTRLLEKIRSFDLLI